MNRIFFGIIDGTGAWDDAEYALSMKNSFCRQIFEANGTPRTDSSVDGLAVESNGSGGFYLRGPSGEGFFIEKRAKIIADRAAISNASQIYLAGYSRGGSASVIAAQMLQERGLSVAGLFLFDPVARHGSASSDTIPGNVQAAYVARRKIGATEMDKYDWSLIGGVWGVAAAAALVAGSPLVAGAVGVASLIKSGGGHNPVRNWFGTTATQRASESTYLRETIEVGSHGALGGVGWKGVSEDIPCQKAVASFFNQAFRENLLSIQLESRVPSSSF